MALNDNAIITIDDFKLYYGMVNEETGEPAETKKDLLVESSINEASSMIWKFLNGEDFLNEDDELDIPADVVRVCKELSALLFINAPGGEGRLGIKSESKGSGASVSRTYYSTPDTLLDQLSRYRLLNIASFE